MAVRVVNRRLIEPRKCSGPGRPAGARRFLVILDGTTGSLLWRPSITHGLAGCRHGLAAAAARCLSELCVWRKGARRTVETASEPRARLVGGGCERANPGERIRSVECGATCASGAGFATTPPSIGDLQQRRLVSAIRDNVAPPGGFVRHLGVIAAVVDASITPLVRAKPRAQSRFSAFVPCD